MPTPTEAIKAFLTQFTHADLAALYSYEMEVQVNVAQDGGDRVQKQDGFVGRIWNEYTDGIQTWKPFRIPWNAATKPEYSELIVSKDRSIPIDSKTHEQLRRKMKYDLFAHAEGIGMTGWNWSQGISKWVAFDFDGIIGHADSHSAKLSADELDQVQKVACDIPWVTVRKSTGGGGLHLYVFLDDVPTENHTEHAALGRSILSKMSAEAGFDFTSKVDACGGNMWVWHRKMSKDNEGLFLVKSGGILQNVPLAWKDHVQVIKGNRRKNLPQFIPQNDQSLFEQTTSERPRTDLDEGHKRLLTYLKEINAQWWWDNDHWMLVCHTADLKQAHEELDLRGIFNTVAQGTNRGADHNCFAFPLDIPEGAWTVRRYTPNVQEKPNWDQDASGWTRCYFNREPTLRTAAHSFDGIEGEKGEFHFSESEVASRAVKALGAHLALPVWACSRTTQIKEHKDGRLVVYIQEESNDKVSDMVGWRRDKGWWKKIFDAKLTQPKEVSVENFDNIIRHIVDIEGNDYGWVIKSDNKWHSEPLVHIRAALKAVGLSQKESELAVGQCVVKSWALINEPFEDEFPGNRRWNRGAVQFRFLPKQEEPFNCPTWNKILNHTGSGLNVAIKENGWCAANGIMTGGDYLRVWIASLFQEPKQHLPYLFLYSKEEQTGKSTLHEAISLLITKKGYARADAAFISQQAFNAELEHAILCVIQETDLRKNTQARNRLKDWVDSSQIPIHTKNKTPYLAPNLTHYIHTANDPNECPIFPGDTRITMGYVAPIDPLELIPRKQLYKQLESEAPAFMATVLKLEIPPCSDRLNIPVVETQEKFQSGQLNRTELEIFIDENAHYSPGQMILYAELWDRFQEWVNPNDLHLWSKIRLGRELPQQFPKGRCMAKGAQFYVGNISWSSSKDLNAKKLMFKDGKLELED